MSFQAWEVAVALKVQSNAAVIFSALSQHLSRADGEIGALNKKMLLFGGAMATTGIAGMKMVTSMIKPAEEYTSQLLRMNTAGMSHVEVAQSAAAAWKLAGENMTTTATGNLKSILDLRNVTGDMNEAITLLPMMQRMQTILAASSEHKLSAGSIDLAYSAAKALDVRGAVSDQAKLERQADLMTRVIMATQGRVTPDQFQSVFQYSRQAKFAMSDDFAYKVLPTLMQEAAGKAGGGGGSRGVGPMMSALYRFTNQGFVNRKSLPLLSELGWLGEGGALKTSGRGTVVGPLKDSELAASNSFEWAKKRFEGIDAYLTAHKLEKTESRVLQIINEATRGNQLAGSILGEYYVKRKNFERDQKLIEGVMSPADAYQQAITKDPATARRALSASWVNFETSLMMNVVPVLVPALNQLAKGLNGLGAWSRANPDMTKGLVLGFTALSGAMAIGGALTILKVGFGGLGTVLGGPGGAGGGLVGALGRAGPAVGLLAAAIGGYAVGSFISSCIEGTKAADKIGSAIAHIFAFFGSKDAQAAINAIEGPTKGGEAKSAGFGENGGGAAFGNPNIRHRTNQPIQVNTTLTMDGRKVGEASSRHIAGELSRPSTGGRTFDGSMSLRQFDMSRGG
ncbi:hypothetical protein [Variovorax sp. LG9.2]|uniref:hypothetical protein n=1 Tax=Variovorax sp. LG9.2 TaxID=3048626 RepID=UPI002B239CE1|nr:hypothetical protein [Variovorax sp. LG9.2]MEB0059242.1 hypothetical protein [Variovorax sp. LG9.2]